VLRQVSCPRYDVCTDSRDTVSNIEGVAFIPLLLGMTLMAPVMATKLRLDLSGLMSELSPNGSRDTHACGRAVVTRLNKGSR
jgi:hypothetical protein